MPWLERVLARLGGGFLHGQGDVDKTSNNVQEEPKLFTHPHTEVIFFQTGGSPLWMVHCVLTTAAFQPSRRQQPAVHVLTDSPKSFKLVVQRDYRHVRLKHLGIELHNIRNYSKRAEVFAKRYIHQSLNSYDYEHLCLRRWQYVLEFVQARAASPATSWVVADADIAIVAPAAWLGSPLYDALLYGPGALGVWSSQALASFADFLMRTYDPARRDTLKDLVTRYSGTTLTRLDCSSLANAHPGCPDRSTYKRWLVPPMVTVDARMWSDMSMQRMWVRNLTCGEAAMFNRRSKDRWQPCGPEPVPEQPLRVGWFDHDHVRATRRGIRCATPQAVPNIGSYNEQCQCNDGGQASCNLPLERNVTRRICSIHFQGSGRKALAMKKLPRCMLAPEKAAEGAAVWSRAWEHWRQALRQSGMRSKRAERVPNFSVNFPIIFR